MITLIIGVACLYVGAFWGLMRRERQAELANRDKDNAIADIEELKAKNESDYAEMQLHVIAVQDMLKGQMTELKETRDELVAVIDSLHGGRRIAKRYRTEFGIVPLKDKVPDEPMRQDTMELDEWGGM